MEEWNRENRYAVKLIAVHVLKIERYAEKQMLLLRYLKETLCLKIVKLLLGQYF